MPMKRTIFVLLATAALMLLSIIALRRRTLEPFASVQRLQPLPPSDGTSISQTPAYAQVQQMLNTVNIDNLTNAEAENLYYTLMEQQHVKCPVSKRIGAKDDGGYEVCFAHPFDLRKSSPCIVFSFGVGGMWQYDDTLAKEYNCKVYMYDPSMKMKDHQRTNSSWFFNIGVSSENTVQPNGWKMRTVCSAFEDNGYGDKIIDAMKIDVEQAEWVSFERALKDGCLRRVKLLTFETHTAELGGGRSDFRRFDRILFGLLRIGFRGWRWIMTPWGPFHTSPHTKKRRGCCYEYFMVNTAFLSPKS